MPPLRLIGLFLFITSLFLALMAVATRTSHIDVLRPQRLVANERPEPVVNQPAGGAPELQFVAVPIIYPLGIIGTLGLLMWFVPSLTLPSKQATKKRRSSRRKKSAKRRTYVTR